MKAKSLIWASLLALCSSSFAATYTINNGSTTTASGIGTSDGSIFRNSTTVGSALGGTNGGISAGPGVIGLGIFSTESLSGLTASQLVASFTQFGSLGTFSAGGPTGARGVFSIGMPNVTIGGNATFENKNMFLFVGNGTTFANSTEFLVLKNTKTFVAGDDAVPTGVTVSFTTSNSTLLFGANAANIFTTSTDTSITPGWTTVAPVPEPSVALLGVLGLFGLIRRRR